MIKSDSFDSFNFLNASEASSLSSFSFYSIEKKQSRVELGHIWDYQEPSFPLLHSSPNPCRKKLARVRHRLARLFTSFTSEQQPDKSPTQTANIMLLDVLRSDSDHLLQKHNQIDKLNLEQIPTRVQSAYDQAKKLKDRHIDKGSDIEKLALFESFLSYTSTKEKYRQLNQASTTQEDLHKLLIEAQQNIGKLEGLKKQINVNCVDVDLEKSTFLNSLKELTDKLTCLKIALSLDLLVSDYYSLIHGAHHSNEPDKFLERIKKAKERVEQVPQHLKRLQSHLESEFINTLTIKYSQLSQEMNNLESLLEAFYKLKRKTSVTTLPAIQNAKYKTLSCSSLKDMPTEKIMGSFATLANSCGCRVNQQRFFNELDQLFEKLKISGSLKREIDNLDKNEDFLALLARFKREQIHPQRKTLTTKANLLFDDLIDSIDKKVGEATEMAEEAFKRAFSHSLFTKSKDGFKALIDQTIARKSGREISAESAASQIRSRKNTQHYEERRKWMHSSLNKLALQRNKNYKEFKQEMKTEFEKYVCDTLIDSFIDLNVTAKHQNLVFQSLATSINEWLPMPTHWHRSLREKKNADIYNRSSYRNFVEQAMQQKLTQILEEMKANRVIDQKTFDENLIRLAVGNQDIKTGLTFDKLISTIKEQFPTRALEEVDKYIKSMLESRSPEEENQKYLLLKKKMNELLTAENSAVTNLLKIFTGDRELAKQVKEAIKQHPKYRSLVDDSFALMWKIIQKENKKKNTKDDLQPLPIIVELANQYAKLQIELSYEKYKQDVLGPFVTHLRDPNSPPAENDNQAQPKIDEELWDRTKTLSFEDLIQEIELTAPGKIKDPNMLKLLLLKMNAKSLETMKDPALSNLLRSIDIKFFAEIKDPQLRLILKEIKSSLPEELIEAYMDPLLQQELNKLTSKGIKVKEDQIEEIRTNLKQRINRGEDLYTEFTELTQKIQIVGSNLSEKKLSARLLLVCREYLFKVENIFGSSKEIKSIIRNDPEYNEKEKQIQLLRHFYNFCVGPDLAGPVFKEMTQAAQKYLMGKVVA